MVISLRCLFVQKLETDLEHLMGFNGISWDFMGFHGISWWLQWEYDGNDDWLVVIWIFLIFPYIGAVYHPS